MVKVTCDRCDRPITGTIYRVKSDAVSVQVAEKGIVNLLPAIGGTPIGDLCEKCHRDFERFMQPLPVIIEKGG